jgi:hypothetical protein
MSTNDVPGYKSSNRDELAMGCWAEHEDGSLIFVESTEGGRAVYSMFDMEKKPVIEYRDAMAIGAFKKMFSFDGRNEKWTWHDKTPFPWDRIIKAGGRDGTRYADVEDHLTEAERIRRKRRSLRVVRDEDDADEESTAVDRVRRSREINEGREVDPYEIEARIERTMGKAGNAIVSRIQKALAGLKPGKGKR